MKADIEKQIKQFTTNHTRIDNKNLEEQKVKDDTENLHKTINNTEIGFVQFPTSRDEELSENQEKLRKLKKSLESLDEIPDEKLWVKINPCKRCLARFSKPGLFEIIEIASLCLYFVILILKIIHYELYQTVQFKTGEFYEIGTLENFQYAIQSLDFFLLMSISLFLFRNASLWIPHVAKTKQTFVLFMSKYAIYILISAILCSLTLCLYL